MSSTVIKNSFPSLLWFVCICMHVDPCTRAACYVLRTRSPCWQRFPTPGLPRVSRLRLGASAVLYCFSGPPPLGSPSYQEKMAQTLFIGWLPCQLL